MKKLASRLRRRRYLLPALLVLPAAWLPTQLFYDGFESGTIDSNKWKPSIHPTGLGWASAMQPTFGARQGSKAMKVTMNKDPQGQPGDKQRVEHALKQNGIIHFTDFNQQYGYHFSVYVPSDWEPDIQDTISQWFAPKDVDPITGQKLDGPRGPAMSLKLKAVDEGSNNWVHYWELVLKWDDNPATTVNPDSFTRIVLWTENASSDLGRWVDFEVYLKWDWNPNGAGYVKMYRDGQVVVDYNGPTGFHDDKGPYYKCGLYKYTWHDPSANPNVTSRTLYFDRVILNEEPRPWP
ncbi:MAG: hypothetical protein DWQ01_03595 [Planctomycetota bacterium]|nr:MAG: hypothetical protein DWQ01_03595 [Planctomycetota bacterium]